MSTCFYHQHVLYFPQKINKYQTAKNIMHGCWLPLSVQFAHYLKAAANFQKAAL
jgi:hypothetical protein